MDRLCCSPPLPRTTRAAWTCATAVHDAAVARGADTARCAGAQTVGKKRAGCDCMPSQNARVRGARAQHDANALLAEDKLGHRGWAGGCARGCVSASTQSSDRPVVVPASMCRTLDTARADHVRANGCWARKTQIAAPADVGVHWAGSNPLSIEREIGIGQSFAGAVPTIGMTFLTLKVQKTDATGSTSAKRGLLRGRSKPLGFTRVASMGRPSASDLVTLRLGSSAWQRADPKKGHSRYMFMFCSFRRTRSADSLQHGQHRFPILSAWGVRVDDLPRAETMSERMAAALKRCGRDTHAGPISIAVGRASPPWPTEGTQALRTLSVSDVVSCGRPEEEDQIGS